MVNDQLVKVEFHTLFKRDLDQKGMIDVTSEFARMVKPGDVVLFYYSGYGMQDQDRNFLLPVSYDPKDDTGITSKAYQVSFFLRQLEDLKPGLRIIVLDAAWDAGLPEMNQGLANMRLAMDRTIVAFPTQPGQVIKSPAGNAPGRFAQALVDTLKEPGVNVVDLFNRVGRKVNTLDSAQRPFSIQPALDDFYFIPPEEKKPIIRTVEVEKPLQMGDHRENPKDLLTYVWIIGSKFDMGCVDNDQKCGEDEKPRHSVTIDKNFWISSSEVTVKAYVDGFLKANQKHKRPPKSAMNYKNHATDMPIVNVSWDDAQDYCKWVGGSLPTEAEWEFAARAGKSGEIYPWGNTIQPSNGNYMSKKATALAAVKSFSPNQWGLFDMAGNVMEWVMDTYNAKAYLKGPATNPVETVPGAKEHVVRGGSLYGGPEDLRISARAVADKPNNQTGFRCVVPNF